MGPLPTTVERFWQMVWEHRCTGIVMVTGLWEKGRMKCFEYFPVKAGETKTFGECRRSSVLTSTKLLSSS